ncbi:MAG TPA: hypothetical protein VJV75_02785 [Candidatus Polarisedimenticolia bacterium]|nr:hypothetical protein [Candidatus Polarisedimenticolia bacterium]
MRTVRRSLILAFLAGIVLFAIYIWAAWSFAYSEGERAGYVQKFSKKGWICKTWEGELAMANLPGAMPEVFPFTVHDDKLAEEITRQMGERVSVHYEEHKGLPTSCFGDTGHFVTGIRRVTE